MSTDHMSFEHKPFEIVEFSSRASDYQNEDRVGNSATHAWVIDGATDLVTEPLVGNASDADWLAEEAQNLLCEIDGKAAWAPLPHLPQQLNERLAQKFRDACRREPAHRWEHPSAAALIVRFGDRKLEWVSLGDCAMIAETPQGLKCIGVGGPDAGDRFIVDDLTRFNAEKRMTSDQERKERMWPDLREKRGERLNAPGGYPVLSITPPPQDMVASGQIEIADAGHALLATDGLMRLVEIFGRYTPQDLLDAAITKGIEQLLNEVRELEMADAECLKHPRIKRSDDATGLLLKATS